MSEPESLNIDNVLKTRRQCTRDRLYADINEEFTRKQIAADVVYEKCLKRPTLPENAAQIAELNSKYPLQDAKQSAEFSFWKLLANPARQFRRTYETTKPDSEYFRDAQWRWIYAFLWMRFH